ncbi:four helix bundle protein [Agriterribacter sp.]|uniref:four helix bundle protein n=1 Tax=Agriterribacter sp. TaxID=2821509 RepID=UPI002D1FA7E0|nr:four helix bundle protein [Agriterribacter sp.]
MPDIIFADTFIFYTLKLQPMFIQLKQKSLDVYQAIRNLVNEIYKISLHLPNEEKFNMVQQIRRAALSVKLNMAEGSTRNSFVERRRYYEVARGSVVETDAILETAVDLKYLDIKDLSIVSSLLNKCFAMLSRMITLEKQ